VVLDDLAKDAGRCRRAPRAGICMATNGTRAPVAIFRNFELNVPVSTSRPPAWRTGFLRPRVFGGSTSPGHGQRSNSRIERRDAASSCNRPCQWRRCEAGGYRLPDWVRRQPSPHRHDFVIE